MAPAMELFMAVRAEHPVIGQVFAVGNCADQHSAGDQDTLDLPEPRSHCGRREVFKDFSTYNDIQACRGDGKGLNHAAASVYTHGLQPVGGLGVRVDGQDLPVRLQSATFQISVPAAYVQERRTWRNSFCQPEKEVETGRGTGKDLGVLGLKVRPEF